MTVPVPAVSGGVRGWFTDAAKPSWGNDVPVLVIVRVAAVPVCSVIAPPVMVGATPVIVVILDSKVPTLSPKATSGKVALPAAPALTVIVVPSTTLVSLALKFSESVPAAPPSTVATVIGCVGDCWFTTAVPVTVLSPNGSGGVGVGSGLTEKSYGLWVEEEFI